MADRYPDAGLRVTAAQRDRAAAELREAAADERLSFDELEAPPWPRFRWAVRASGTRLPSSLADALEPWWAERVAQAERRAAGAKRPRKGVR